MFLPNDGLGRGDRVSLPWQCRCEGAVSFEAAQSEAVADHEYTEGCQRHRQLAVVHCTQHGVHGVHGVL